MGFAIGRNRLQRSQTRSELTSFAETLEFASIVSDEVIRSDISDEAACEESTVMLEDGRLPATKQTLSLAALEDALAEHADTLVRLCQRHRIFCQPQNSSPYQIGSVPACTGSHSYSCSGARGGCAMHVRHALAGAEHEEHLAVHCYLQDCAAAAQKLLGAVAAARQESCCASEGAPPAAPDCAVCLCPMTNDLVALPCGHVFHSACISSAAVATVRCPLCRMLIGSNPIVLPLFFG